MSETLVTTGVLEVAEVELQVAELFFKPWGQIVGVLSEDYKYATR